MEKSKQKHGKNLKLVVLYIHFVIIIFVRVFDIKNRDYTTKGINGITIFSDAERKDILIAS